MGPQPSLSGLQTGSPLPGRRCNLTPQFRLPILTARSPVRVRLSRLRKGTGTMWRKLCFLLCLHLLVSTGSAPLFSQTVEPIRLHPKNPHYFLFRGKPTVLITSGEHYGSVLNGGFDYKKYLATLAADGMNFTRIFGGSYVEVPATSFGIKRNTLAPLPGKFIAPWMRSEIGGYAGGGNKFDLTKWNPEYFARYKDFLAEAAKAGIVVEISLFSSTYGDVQWTVSPFNSANNVNNTEVGDWKKVTTIDNGNVLKFQEEYVRKLVRESNAFDNVIFEIQNEPWSDRPVLSSVVNPYLQKPARDNYPNSVDLADEASIAWQGKVAEWIASEEAALLNKHLIAQNYCNFYFPVRALLPQVSIVNFHYAYAQAALDNYGLDKAIGYDETGFLGREDKVYLRQAWNFLLSGGGTFDGLDYSFSVGHEAGDDTEPNGPGGGSAKFRRQLAILQKFLQRFSLTEMRPDRDVVKHAAGVSARVLSNPDREYAIYLDGDGPADLTLELPKGYYSAEWINPATGAVLHSESFGHSGGSKMLTSPKFSEGAVLRLVNQ